MSRSALDATFGMSHVNARCAGCSPHRTTTTMSDELRGFDKEARELIASMVVNGWTGRRTSKGHWIGKAPDGTTITVPSKMSAPNRTSQNTRAQYARWVKAQALPDSMVIGIRDDDPVIEEVLLAASQKHVDAVLEHFEAEREREMAVIESLKPWVAKKQPQRNGGQVYESAAVMERRWSDGKVDYVCAAASCEFVADKPRSVSSHYGQMHTSKGEGTPYEEAAKHVMPDMAYTEPLSHREYRPTDRLLNALAEWLAERSWENVDDLAALFLTWAHDRPDLDGLERQPARELTDTEIVQRVRMLVGQPLAIEVDRLKEEMDEMRAKLEQRTKERDEVAAQLVKVQGDLDAIRDMLEVVGR